MIDQFLAYEVEGRERKIPPYLIASRAPINIDDPEVNEEKPNDTMEEIKTTVEEDKLFSAYKVVVPMSEHWTQNGLHAYLFESTAKDNIDDNLRDNISDSNYIDKLKPLSVTSNGGVVDEIVEALRSSKDPTLVISVHGFNNPRDVILPGYWESFTSVHNDIHINNKDIVCIGYRWPSEGLWTPISSILSPDFEPGQLSSDILKTVQ
jgi:hypothetical protein